VDIEAVADKVQKLGEKEISIISSGNELWKVRIIFPTLESSDLEMIGRLRQAKNLIHHVHRVPQELLELREVIDKRRVPEGVAIDVEIGKIRNDRGRPVIRFKSLESPGGAVFQDMIAEVNFHYKDEFDQPISVNRIQIELDRQGIDKELCDFEGLEKEIEKATKNEGYVKEFEIARGKLPDDGTDAELEYTFFTDLESAEDASDYKESRRVEKGDILCQKIPAKNGKNTGVDAHGAKVPPQKGLDFDLVSVSGVELSMDGTKLTASIDGMAFMARTERTIFTPAGEKTIPDKVEITVKPIKKVNADEIQHLVTEDAVEVKGTLKKGTSITTSGEVFLEGDVEDGAVVRAGSNVLIDGDIRGGEISSNQSVTSTKGAKGTTIVASENVKLNGIAENSKVIGQRVSLEAAKGSEIIASEKILLKQAGSDDAGNKSTIRVGRQDFYKEKIEANHRNIMTMKKNLGRITEIFGKKNVTKLNETNWRQIFIQYLKEERKAPGKNLPEKYVAALRQLLESVVPMKKMVAEMTRELNILLQKMKEADKKTPMVVIREKVKNRVNVEIGGKKLELGPSREGVKISMDNKGGLKTDALRAG
jgi:uncharacterized protein (DUF342 family)